MVRVTGELVPLVAVTPKASSGLHFQAVTLSGSSHTNRCRLEVSVTPRAGVGDSSHPKYSCIYRCMLSIGVTVSQ